MQFGSYILRRLIIIFKARLRVRLHRSYDCNNTDGDPSARRTHCLPRHTGNKGNT